jgi:hypothetical protein
MDSFGGETEKKKWEYETLQYVLQHFVTQGSFQIAHLPWS